tara:strand:+ start:19688 stop:19795 length:108 start_codon:yes stop_codon:yes gene_type:complete
MQLFVLRIQAGSFDLIAARIKYKSGVIIFFIVPLA